MQIEGKLLIFEGKIKRKIFRLIQQPDDSLRIKISE